MELLAGLATPLANRSMSHPLPSLVSNIRLGPAVPRASRFTTAPISFAHGWPATNARAPAFDPRQEVGHPRADPDWSAGEAFLDLRAMAEPLQLGCDAPTHGGRGGRPGRVRLPVAHDCAEDLAGADGGELPRPRVAGPRRRWPVAQGGGGHERGEERQGRQELRRSAVHLAHVISVAASPGAR